MCVFTSVCLEDRLVKTMFKEVCTVQDVSRGCSVGSEALVPHYQLVYRKPILPRLAELAENHRLVSAKLWVIEKIAN